jgi:acyl-CoA thioester hydrolase
LKNLFQHTIRVRYAECDSMGFVHHSVYPTYFEEARTEALRSIGLNYKDVEDSGIIMPVRSMHVHFKRAAVYDDLLLIHVFMDTVKGIRCVFHYETRNQHNELLNTGSTELFFADKSTLRPIKLPAELAARFSGANDHGK